VIQRKFIRIALRTCVHAFLNARKLIKLLPCLLDRNLAIDAYCLSASLSLVNIMSMFSTARSVSLLLQSLPNRSHASAMK
jgi:hypothetical protein